MSEFDSYYQNIEEPDKRQKYNNWSISKGLQQVDGLSTSPYLDKLASDNIEGRISSSDVTRLVNSYYEVKADRKEVDEYKEADIVSARINEILSSGGFTLSLEEYKSIHKRLFDGVIDNAGEFRSNNIYKREWVLDGDTVTYGDVSNIESNIESCIRGERLTRYSSMDDEEIYFHLSRFVSELWKAHPFSEGNTRTTAVFAIKYFRSRGYDIDNRPFQNHSWYFRNALVRANYSSIPKKVDTDLSFLEEFLTCAITGRVGTFRNRDLHIYARRTGLDKSSSGDSLDNAILKEICKNRQITRKQLAEKFLTSEKTIERHLKKLNISFEGPAKTGHWLLPSKADDIIPEIDEEQVVLDEIIGKMNSLFRGGQFEGLSVKFERYDNTEPVSAFNPVLIDELIFRFGAGLYEWSIENGLLNQQGWHTFPDGSSYNIKTGEYIAKDKNRKQEKIEEKPSPGEKTSDNNTKSRLFNEETASLPKGFSDHIELIGRYDGMVELPDGTVGAVQKIGDELRFQDSGSIAEAIRQTNLIDGDGSQAFVVDGKTYALKDPLERYMDILPYGKGAWVKGGDGEEVYLAFSIERQRLIPSISYEDARKEVIKRREESEGKTSAKKKSPRQSKGRKS